MEKNLKLLAVCHMILAGFQLLAAVIITLFMTVFLSWMNEEGVRMEQDQLPQFATMIMSIVPALLILLALPGMLAGIGLLHRRPWARILAMVVGGVQILSFPFGTAIGVFSLWVLLDDEVAVLFRSGSVEQAEDG